LYLEKQLMTYEYKELNEHLANDFLEFGSSGNTFDKKAHLDTRSSILWTRVLTSLVSNALTVVVVIGRFILSSMFVFSRKWVSVCPKIMNFQKQSIWADRQVTKSSFR